MKMDSARCVTSIGTTFEVGMFFGLLFFFENRLKKLLVERMFWPIHRFMAKESVNKSS